MSTRSLIIESTSRPTYPTSVNFVASTFIKGAPERFATLLAISVLPIFHFLFNKKAMATPPSPPQARNAQYDMSFPLKIATLSFASSSSVAL